MCFVGRIFSFAQELGRRHETRTDHIFAFAGFALSISENLSIRAIHIASFADDKWKRWISQFFTHIGDEMYEIHFVLCGSCAVATVVPPLKPNEAINLRRALCKLWKCSWNRSECGAELADHLVVERTSHSTRTWWTKIFRKTFSAPCSLDEQNR